ncbi:hypothetical protein [Siminovitchia fortis]|uniref:hypothetical protein n=1 Tax=Siminovitchia fortis TaxID=254758 RepID=UPI00119E3B96|nr:hypothetical protein [Siminovitchia fortis]
MSRKIEIEFPDTEIKVLATLLDNDEPELCDMFWDRLETPQKMACGNTWSTGDLYVAAARPPKEPVSIGSQANPIGRNQIPLCDLEPGTLVYTGLEVWVAYGNSITEPLVPSGAAVAKVDEEYLDDFYKAGRSVWESNSTHRLVTMTVKRKVEQYV